MSIFQLRTVQVYCSVLLSVSFQLECITKDAGFLFMPDGVYDDRTVLQPAESLVRCVDFLKIHVVRRRRRFCQSEPRRHRERICIEIRGEGTTMEFP